MEVILGLAVVVLLALAAWLFQARSKAERDLAVTREQLAQAERRGGELEQLKSVMLQSAQAAMLATAGELNNQLLASHKAENAVAKQDAEARVQKASETFLKQVDELAKRVAEIGGQREDDRARIDTLVRSLSNPGGAGQLAEIGLANTLQSLGLEKDRDYKIQFSTTDAETGKRLRPDAVVFLPNDWTIVVDCKASKFLYDIAANEGTEEESVAWQGLAGTMSNHLKALASKDYQGAVLAACRESGRTADATRMLSLMYLPSEAALEKVRRADPEFMGRARAAGISPVDPDRLYFALSFASAEIGLMRRAENHQQIIDGTRALIEAVGVVLGHALAVGKGLKSASESFGQLTNSVNKRLLAKIRNLGKLGVQPAKPLPGNLPDFSINVREGATIEGEAEEVETPAPPPRPRLIGE
ncbi:MAG: DNA recombination protein RmuC [Alphaproteobacteria bacterium]|nr:DNA recombination protein RmuC [Alphaproteobacteria bacterium]